MEAPKLFEEDTIVTQAGESFSMPVSYKGWAVYFGSLEHVNVPESLQADFGRALNDAFDAGVFTPSADGTTETGDVTMKDGDVERTFHVVITLVEVEGEDDYYSIQSVIEDAS